MGDKEVKYAGFHQRLLAHNIDLIPILGLLYGVSFLIPRTQYEWVIFLGIYLLYHSGFEMSNWRATPGKKWVKLKVTAEEDHIEARIVLRNLTRFLSLILFFGGFILILFNKRRKGLHDYLAGTLVLFDES